MPKMTRDQRFRQAAGSIVDSLGKSEFRLFAQEIDNDGNNEFHEAVQEIAMELFPEDFNSDAGKQ